MIHLRNVEKRYARGSESVLACAVDRLDIQAGEQVALIGRSGTGKTILLRLIAGVEEPTAGLIEIGGHDVSDIAPEHRGVGMAF